MFGARKSSSPSGGSRIFRSIISIVVISAFVLSVSYAVKRLYELKLSDVAEYSDPVLEKVGLDTEKIGDVAGVITKRIDEKINSAPSIGRHFNPNSSSFEAKSNVVGTLAVLSDIENNNDNLRRALTMIQEEGISEVIILGDLTSWGDDKSMLDVKRILDSFNVMYWVIPGDHDLAASVEQGDTTGLAIFKRIFGSDKYFLNKYGINILIVNNSANYTPLSDEDMGYINNYLQQTDVLFLSQPLVSSYVNRSMGNIDGAVTLPVKEQADLILSFIRSNGVKMVVAGDHHIFSKTNDSSKQSLTHYTIGAVTDENNFGSPGYTTLTIYDDGSLLLEERELLYE